MTRQIHAARLRSQLLLNPAAAGVESAVERLLAVQAQDQRAFRLAIRSRTRSTTVSDVDAALTEHRSLVVSWLCRGTLHLVRAEDYWWLHDLTAPRMATGVRRRLAQLGVDEAATGRGVDTVLTAVSERPRSRAELRAALDAAGVATEGQALVHVLAATSLREHLVRGPVLDGEHCFVDARTWLTSPPERDRDEALQMLALRYLAGHGPATAADLAAYAGITLTDARRAFGLADPHTCRVDEELRALSSPDADSALPPPRLLGMFDPVLHGWADRSFVTGSHTAVVTSNGLFRATALVNGRVAATWTLKDGAVTLTPLERLSQPTLAALRREAEDVYRFLDLPTKPLKILDD